MEKVEFIEEPNYVEMKFDEVGYYGWNIGLTILFSKSSSGFVDHRGYKEDSFIFHYNLRCTNGTLKVRRSHEDMFHGKYDVDYDDVISMIESDMPRLYMPKFLQVLYNLNRSRNKRIFEIESEDSVNIGERNLNSNIMEECEEMLEILNKKR